jgi:hypothetical protein
MKNITLTIAIILGSLITVNAQTSSSATATQTVTLILKNAISINITSATGNNFAFENTSDYANGLVNTNATGLEVKSNRPWAVTVNTTTANFSGPAAPAAAMPASVVGVRLNGGAAYTNLSTTAASLTTGGRGIGSFSVDYKANPGYTYDAGTYTISVVYTATQQ